MWTGINEQYFLVAAVAMGVDKAVCEIEAAHKEVLTASLMYPEVVIPPGGSVTHQYRLFAGPKRLNFLEDIQGGVGGAEQNAKLDESVDFGWLGFLCHPMLWLLKEFFGLVGNYGIAIVFLTIVIKLLLLPLTQKSMKSMKEMAKLKPMMDDLKKKYGDDKQRLNQEMMALYKSHKINPMGGCFPLLLQMPIWIALYRMLYSAVELYQTPFIPGWIDDMSFRDPYYIMPIVMGLSMFLQQKLSPTSADTQQAKMMLYAMPIFFTFIMLYLPSGLVLYIFVNSILSIAHQLIYNKMTDKTPPGAGAKTKEAQAKT
jgi:YidC/Oxa1 family membrane protein insertase